MNIDNWYCYKDKFSSNVISTSKTEPLCIISGYINYHAEELRIPPENIVEVIENLGYEFDEWTRANLPDKIYSQPKFHNLVGPEYEASYSEDEGPHLIKYRFHNVIFPNGAKDRPKIICKVLTCSLDKVITNSWSLESVESDPEDYPSEQPWVIDTKVIDIEGHECLIPVFEDCIGPVARKITRTGEHVFHYIDDFGGY